ncbi:hypothetical protein [Streptomyces sp. A1-5]|uniref:hypothetical protein n=1 Tax=Streptomyces sp. A1-5 TaxID=2738410 RepID=UPI001F3ED69F|nr:hypothetical protein [Streptomyces sp. A1-5]UJB40188.1 hypothetical protein HRD51_04240 [Streptomyces sp. A1-5]
MTARVAINGPSRIARSTLTDHALDAAGIVSVITRKTTDAEANDIFRQEAAPGRYRDGLEIKDDPPVPSSTVPGLRASAVEHTLATAADDSLRAVMAGYDHERGGAQQTVRQTPAVLGQAAPSR